MDTDPAFRIITPGGVFCDIDAIVVIKIAVTGFHPFRGDFTDRQILRRFCPVHHFRNDLRSFAGEAGKFIDQVGPIIGWNLSRNNSQRVSPGLIGKGYPVAVIDRSSGRDLDIHHQPVSAGQLRHDQAVFPLDLPGSVFQNHVQQVVPSDCSGKNRIIIHMECHLGGVGSGKGRSDLVCDIFQCHRYRRVIIAGTEIVYRDRIN